MYKRTFLSAVALCAILAATNNVVATGDKQSTEQTQQELQQAAKAQKANAAQPVINRTDKEVFSMLVLTAAGAAFYLAVKASAENATILN